MAVLRVNGLTKCFGINSVFENVSFELKSGEHIGLVGANGAGKTTLLKCIMGREEADRGTIKASDGAVIGYLRQDFDYAGETIRDEMEEAWKDVLFYKDRMERLAAELEFHKDDADLVLEYGNTEARFEFLGGYDYESATKKILTGLGFTEEDWDRDIHSFSGGQKVRINLAAAFVRHPDFLLLDEPTRGIDVGAKYEIYQLILDLAKKGKTVIMVSSEMAELLGVCDKILVMSGGRLSGEVDAKTTNQEEIMTLAAKYV